MRINSPAERALLESLRHRLEQDSAWFPITLDSNYSEVALARFEQAGLLKKRRPGDYEIQVDAVLRVCEECEAAGEMLTEQHLEAEKYRNKGEWCTAEYANLRWAISPQLLTRAAQEGKGAYGVTVHRQKAKVGAGKPVYVYNRRELEALAEASDRHRSKE